MKEPSDVMQPRVLRAALYERVSTDEQAMRGYSIEAQIDGLTEYCKKHGYKVVDHYTDDGVSGGLSPWKRPAMKRLLEDVKDGKIDIIIFTKLDRWFRSVEEYYKVQPILQEHNVEWKTILEDYDTTTANGRMAITIFLAIAQNERERTAERINYVFDHKFKNGEAAFGGQKCSLGFMKQEIDGIVRLVKNPEEEEMTKEFWDIVLKYKNINMAGRYMNDVYGFNYDRATWAKMVTRTFYYGSYRGNDNFCPAYVTKEEWESVQPGSGNRVKKAQNGRVYLFTGMMRCPECGRRMAAGYGKGWDGTEYNSYRCKYVGSGICTFKPRGSERKIEAYLLENLHTLLKEQIEIITYENSLPKPKPKVDIAALKEKLRRLNVVYMAGGKSDKEYLTETAELKAAIEKAQLEAPPPERDVEKYKQLLKLDYKKAYEEMDRVDKQRFWRSIIKEIHMDENRNYWADFF